MYVSIQVHCNYLCDFYGLLSTLFCTYILDYLYFGFRKDQICFLETIFADLVQVFLFTNCIFALIVNGSTEKNPTFQKDVQVAQNYFMGVDKDFSRKDFL